jgi:hypothetical protein
MQVLLLEEVKTILCIQIVLFLPAIVTHNRVDLLQIFVLMGCGCYVTKSVIFLYVHSDA